MVKNLYVEIPCFDFQVVNRKREDDEYPDPW